MCVCIYYNYYEMRERISARKDGPRRQNAGERTAPVTRLAALTASSHGGGGDLNAQNTCGANIRVMKA